MEHYFLDRQYLTYCSAHRTLDYRLISYISLSLVLQKMAIFALVGLGLQLYMNMLKMRI